MDHSNTSKFKYYKCRSLLACDTGGTVYDTSERWEESSYRTNNQQNKNFVHCESGQSENIFYFIDAEGKLKSEERSLVDLTTHLDDDEFNDYEMHSNQSFEPEGDIKQSVSNKNHVRQLNLEDQIYNQLQNFDFDLDDSHEEQSVQNLINEILNSGTTFAADYSESCEEINSLGNTGFSNTIKCNTLIDNDEFKQDKTNFHHFINLPQSNFDMFEINKIGIDLNTKHTHKRKQTYNIKEDSFSDIFREGKSILNKVVAINNKSKKKKSFDKENRKEKLQFYKKNPFGNVKMNSILKGTKKQAMVKTIDSRWQRRESVTSSNDENYEQNNNNVIDEVVYESHTCQIDYLSTVNSTNDILQGISTVIKLNSEFSTADYLEYVQPRERIVESDMDKLLSPTVESEISELFKSCKRKQMMKNAHVEVDCNGNEINLQDRQTISNSKTTLTPNEIAERELFLKSAYAKKLGYENYFNTSNDSVVNEILFDSTIIYEEISLDSNLLKTIEIYSKKNQFVDRSFKPVSCTLLESLNEFNRFGGFAEENQAQNKLIHTEENSNTIVIDDESTCNSEESKFYNKRIDLAQAIQNKSEFNQINSYFNFNFSDKSSLLGLDFQSKYNNCNSLQNLIGTDIDTKQSFASLKIKIKRVNDKNKYVIDDSNKQCIDITEKKTLKSIKNLDRYECYDCSAKFRTKRILKNHVSENHRGPYDTECEICHMKFRKSSAHKKHQPWCEKNITHTCDICNKIYCYQASLIKHLRTHKDLFNQNSSWK